MYEDFLVRGEAFLDRHSNFRLIERKEDLKRLNAILLRKQSNNVLLMGPGGVGCTSLCLGLQLSKSETDTPFDIVNKRLFWIDTDGLFAAGSQETLNQNFQRLLRQLRRSPETIACVLTCLNTWKNTLQQS